MQTNNNEKPWLDTTKSFFVSASAGSGKTTLLVERILALLFNGAHPSSILCITYTTTGANEMKEKIEQRINEIRQISNPDDKLKKVSQIICVDKSKLDIVKIEQILQNAISPSGQIEISTFHAFCLKIISLFSAETNINANFTILDTNIVLKEKIFNDIKTKILQDDNLEDLRSDIIKYMPTDFLERIEEVVNGRKNLEDFDEHKTMEAILKCCPSFNSKDLDFDKMLKSEVNLKLPQDIISKYDKIEHNFKDAVENFQASSTNPIFMFLNKNYQIRKKFVNKQSNIPDDILSQLQQEVIKAFDIYCFEVSYKYAKKISIILQIAKHANAFYQNLKQQFGVIDFDDIIEKTKNLLNDQNKAWIAYKLDMHIKHILVDEAQDTNQNQWNIIIQGLFGDLQYGKGSDNNKTILIVGDEKQMIYGFQGSEFKMLEKIYGNIKTTYPINKIQRNINYRSSSVILKFVDEIFKHDEIKSIYGIDVAHIPNGEKTKEEDRGLVEIFMPASAAIQKSERSKNNFFDEKEENQKNHILAKQICDKISNLIQNNIKPSDIMLLAKSRDDDLFNEILVGLEKHNVKISDISKKTIADINCIMSIACLIRLCFIFNDDYSLIYLLNSNIFNYKMQDITNIYLKYRQTKNDDDYFLTFICKQDPNFNDQYNEIKTLVQNLDLQNFLNIVILKYKKYYKSYEQENLSFFFDILQMYQSSMQIDGQNETTFGFIEYLFANSDVRFGSKTADSPDCIKLTTIHSSKGMESKVVMLIDVSKQGNINKKSIFLSPDGVLNLELRKEEDFLDGGFVENYKHNKQKQDAEDLNLLYVAATRAKQILYIFSKDSKGWYNYLNDAVCNLSMGQLFYGDNNLLNFSNDNKKPHDDTSFGVENVNIGSSIRQKKISYSQFANYNNINNNDDNDKNKDNDESDGWLKKSDTTYGVAMHKLLEMCKLINTKSDASMILSHINYKQDDTDKIINDFFALKTKFADILTSRNARFEVEISSHNTQENTINFGRVDLLIETNNDITIYDFKTDSNPNLLLEKYRGQLLFYKQILQSRTSKIIKCNIIWTKTATITNIE